MGIITSRQRIGATGAAKSLIIDYLLLIIVLIPSIELSPRDSAVRRPAVRHPSADLVDIRRTSIVIPPKAG